VQAHHPDEARRMSQNNTKTSRKSAGGRPASFGSERPPISDRESPYTSREEIAAVGSAGQTGNIAFREPVSTRRSGGPLLKLKEAAHYLAISTRQLQYLSHRREVAFIRIGKSGVRYDRADLDEFVARHRSVGLGVGGEVDFG